MTEPRKLLAEYAENGSEEAFRDLVQLYMGLVYSTALRLVNGDTHKAEDIVQTVFSDLARLAKSVPREAMLGGWLHSRTCHVAFTLMRSERRRERREKVVAMESSYQNAKEALEEIAPVLDEAINELKEDDRLAIMLRFFDQRDLRTVGELLGSSDDAAQKRITRALEKLRVLLVRRGVVLSAAGLSLALGSVNASAAPAGLAATVAVGALSSAHAAGSSISATIINAIAMTKLKTAVITAITAIVVVGGGIGTTILMQKRQSEHDFKPPSNADPVKILQEAQDDASNGHFKQALAKHVWLFKHGLDHNKSFAGVRVSFALNAWEKLAQQYPPARKELVATRDDREQNIRSNPTNPELWSVFQDYATINSVLQENDRTIEVFKWLDLNHSSSAKLVFGSVETALVQNKQYELWNKYVDPEMTYQSSLRILGLSRRSPSGGDTRLAELQSKNFARRTATLVALLAINDRREEANRIAAMARKELNDPAFHNALEQAKTGALPNQ